MYTANCAELLPAQVEDAQKKAADDKEKRETARYYLQPLCNNIS